MARSPKFIIYLTIIIDLLGFGIVIPILAPTTTELVRNPETVGRHVAWLMVSFSLLQMLFSPFWGRLSDRHGRRPILLMSLAGSTLAYVLFFLSRSYEVLLFSRILAGVFAANITAAMAYIADITPDEERTAGMGMVGMAFGLGFAFGPVLGGGATHLWQILNPNVAPDAVHAGAAALAALICGANFSWAYFKLPESLPPERRGKTHFKRFASTREVFATLRHPAVGPLILLFFIITFAFSNVEVSFSLYAKRQLGMDIRQIYMMFIFIGLVMAFTQGYLIRRIVKIIPEPTLIVIGSIILMLGLISLPVWQETGPLLGAMAVLALGQGVCQPSILSMMSRSSSAHEQGNVFGTSQAASSLARIVGPAFGGLLYDVSYRLPFWGAAVVMAGATAWALAVRRRLAGEK